MDLSTLNWNNLVSVVSYLGVVLMGASAILLWIYRELNNIRDALYRLHIKIVEEFVSYETHRAFEEKVEKSIGRIEERLDSVLEHIKNGRSARPSKVQS